MRVRFYNDSAHTQKYKDINLLSFTTNLRSISISNRTVDNIRYYYGYGLAQGLDIAIINSAIDDGTLVPYMTLANFQTKYLKTNKQVIATTNASNQHITTLHVGTVDLQSAALLDSNTQTLYVFATNYNNVDYIVIMPIRGHLTLNREYCIIISANFVEESLATQYGDKSKSTPDGGYGTYDNTSDNVGNSAKPTYSMPFGSGFHCYHINGSLYNSISEKLWGRDQSAFLALWQKFKNYKFNPIAGILSCVRIPDQFVPSSGSSSKIQIAGTVISVTAPVVTSGIVDHTIIFDSSWFSEYYASFMDYTDDTQIILHVPFCGTVEIPPYMCVNGDISVNFRCDVITGNVCACITAVDRYGNLCAIQTMTGNCAYPIPFSGNDNGMGDKLKALEGYISGQTAGLASAASGDFGKAAAAGISSNLTLWSGKALARHTTMTAGQHGGSVAICTNLNCYIEIRRSAASQPDYYNVLRGRPSDIGLTVGSFIGFTVFSEVHADIATATAEEKAEIERLLKEGVII